MQLLIQSAERLLMPPMGECQSVSHIRQYVRMRTFYQLHIFSPAYQASYSFWPRRWNFCPVREFFLDSVPDCQVLIYFSKARWKLGGTGRIVNEISSKRVGRDQTDCNETWDKGTYSSVNVWYLHECVFVFRPGGTYLQGSIVYRWREKN